MYHNLTDNQIEKLNSKSKSLPTIDSINKNLALINGLFEYRFGIYKSINKSTLESYPFEIKGFTLEQLQKMEMNYHLTNISVIHASLQNPDTGILIQEFPNFISNSLCDNLMTRANLYLYPSNVCDPIYYTVNGQSCRISNSMTSIIMNQIQQLTNMNPEFYDDMIVTSLPTNGLVIPHFDSDPKMRMFPKWSRAIKIFIFLNDDYTGGELVFPKVNKTIFPEKGKIVLFWINRWTNNQLEQIPESYHLENTVLSGTKMTCYFRIHSKLRDIAHRFHIKLSEDNY